MTDKTLRRRLIRLAYERPELRAEILPLVCRRASDPNPYAYEERLAEQATRLKRVFVVGTWSQIRKELADSLRLLTEFAATSDRKYERIFGKALKALE